MLESCGLLGIDRGTGGCDRRWGKTEGVGVREPSFRSSSLNFLNIYVCSLYEVLAYTSIVTDQSVASCT